jgi:hypothetical protein
MWPSFHSFLIRKCVQRAENSPSNISRDILQDKILTFHFFFIQFCVRCDRSFIIFQARGIYERVTISTATESPMATAEPQEWATCFALYSWQHCIPQPCYVSFYVIGFETQFGGYRRLRKEGEGWSRPHTASLTPREVCPLHWICRP